MSGFSEEIMRDRLRLLANTAHSIQTLSLWLIHHQKKHANIILDTWLKEIKDHNGSERLCALVNLANDVIQNCRKKNPQFMKSFLDVLQPGFCHISEVGDEQCRKTVSRILDVWRDRCIYTPDELDTLRRCLDGVSGLKSPTEPFEAKTPPEENSDSEEPTTSVADNSQKNKIQFKNFQKSSRELVNSLKLIEDPASADEKIRRIIAAYPEAIANPTLLKQINTIEAAEELMCKINEAQPIVHAYCNRLKSELADRRTVQKQLDEYMKALEESCERNSNLINSVREKIGRVDEEKKDIAKHIESLPDLNEVFGSSSLPSLGELFK